MGEILDGWTGDGLTSGFKVGLAWEVVGEGGGIVEGMEASIGWKVLGYWELLGFGNCLQETEQRNCWMDGQLNEGQLQLLHHTTHHSPQHLDQMGNQQFLLSFSLPSLLHQYWSLRLGLLSCNVWAYNQLEWALQH